MPNLPQIGYVGQEPVLFAGNIGTNIANGKPNATEEESECACVALFSIVAYSNWPQFLAPAFILFHWLIDTCVLNP